MSAIETALTELSANLRRMEQQLLVNNLCSGGNVGSNGIGKDEAILHYDPALAAPLAKAKRLHAVFAEQYFPFRRRIKA